MGNDKPDPKKVLTGKVERVEKPLTFDRKHRIAEAPTIDTGADRSHKLAPPPPPPPAKQAAPNQQGGKRPEPLLDERKRPPKGEPLHDDRKHKLAPPPAAPPQKPKK